MTSIAFNNPIFVDVDGGGFKPNGDMLGYPLGLGAITLEEARKLIGTTPRALTTDLRQNCLT